MFFFVYILAGNIRSLDLGYDPIPRKMLWLNYALNIDQRWKMFAPAPSKLRRWYVIPGELLNGEILDLVTESKPLSWKKPENINAHYGHLRWRKYLTLLWEDKYSDYRSYYGRYLCRQWNRQHYQDKRLGRLEIFLVKQRIYDDHISDPKRISLLRHACDLGPDTLPIE